MSENLLKKVIITMCNNTLPDIEVRPVIFILNNEYYSADIFSIPFPRNRYSEKITENSVADITDDEIHAIWPDAIINKRDGLFVYISTELNKNERTLCKNAKELFEFIFDLECRFYILKYGLDDNEESNDNRSDIEILNQMQEKRRILYFDIFGEVEEEYDALYSDEDIELFMECIDDRRHDSVALKKAISRIYVLKMEETYYVVTSVLDINNKLLEDWLEDKIIGFYLIKDEDILKNIDDMAIDDDCLCENINQVQEKIFNLIFRNILLRNGSDYRFIKTYGYAYQEFKSAVLHDYVYKKWIEN